MTVIDDIFDNEIIAQLDLMTGVSVLDGYLTHYANDLLQNKNGLSFPCVAVQPSFDDIALHPAQVKGKVTRQYALVGAVSAIDRGAVNRNINQLVFDVRKALAVDKFKGATKTVTFEFGKTTYSLPESKDQYAFFEMDLKITYYDNWEK